MHPERPVNPLALGRCEAISRQSSNEGEARSMTDKRDNIVDHRGTAIELEVCRCERELEVPGRTNESLEFFDHLRLQVNDPARITFNLVPAPHGWIST